MRERGLGNGVCVPRFPDGARPSVASISAKACLRRLTNDQIRRKPVGVGEEELLRRLESADRTDVDALRAEGAARHVHPDLVLLFTLTLDRRLFMRGFIP